MKEGEKVRRPEGEIKPGQISKKLASSPFFKRESEGISSSIKLAALCRQINFGGQRRR